MAGEWQAEKNFGLPKLEEHQAGWHRQGSSTSLFLTDRANFHSVAGQFWSSTKVPISRICFFPGRIFFTGNPAESACRVARGPIGFGKSPNGSKIMMFRNEIRKILKKFCGRSRTRHFVHWEILRRWHGRMR